MKQPTLAACLLSLLLSGLPAFAQEPPVKVQADPCLKSTCRNVPTRENLSAISLGTKYTRGIIGGFEQGAGVAGGLQFTTADAIPHLELRATALTSLGGARRFDAEALFAGAGSRNHAEVWFSYVQRQTDFFGIGPRSAAADKTSFVTDRRSYQASFYRDITASLQAGVFVQELNSHSGTGSSEGGPPITTAFSGNPDTPGEAWLPGLEATTQIRSYGGFLAFDTRDNSSGLTRGADIYVRIASNDGIKGHHAFADYGWLETEVDARGYIPLGNSMTSLALRARGQLKDPKGGSQIPFYDLSYIGGREHVRGYESYRFRANSAVMAAVELRRTVRKMTDQRGVDVVGFVDRGLVWGDARPAADPALQNNGTFSSSQWNTGVGGGVQYRHSRSLAARVEAGRSSEGTRIYFSMSRGF